jgi:hypothetical protein
MPSKTKKNKPESPKKTYSVVVSRNRFEKDVRVSVQDDSLPHSQAHLSLEIKGLTRANAKNDIMLFSMLHYAIAHVLHERFPDSTEDLNAYNDSFFADLFNVSFDLLNNVAPGDSLLFSIPEADSYTEYSFTGKNIYDAWEKSPEYYYEIFGTEGKRVVTSKRSVKLPVFLD